MSGQKLLVCDLQGVLNKNMTPPLFEFTDPVIHYKSSRGRVNVYGRTDRGENGIYDFFKTHVCSPLCRAMRKTQVQYSISTPTTPAEPSTGAWTRRSPVSDMSHFASPSQRQDAIPHIPDPQWFMPVSKVRTE